MSDENHRALKRWERAKQMSAVRADPDLTGPAAQCRIKGGEAGLERIPVYIVAVFAKDLTCVKSIREPVPTGVPGVWWMVRGGILWEPFLIDIVRHYTLGLPVPFAFRPVRKIGSEIVAQMRGLPGSALLSVFAKLRESGLLPPLPALSRETCPVALPWENLRACFQDFLGEP
jgi:hypothetical protein